MQDGRGLRRGLRLRAGEPSHALRPCQPALACKRSRNHVQVFIYRPSKYLSMCNKLWRNWSLAPSLLCHCLVCTESTYSLLSTSFLPYNFFLRPQATQPLAASLGCPSVCVAHSSLTCGGDLLLTHFISQDVRFNRYAASEECEA